jgi:uncharacterized protein (TIGR04255 family)
MSAKLSNAPVFYTIAQVRFNAVLNMSAYIPDIQASLRSAYPDFSYDKSKAIQVVNVGDPEKLPEVRTLETDRWHFKNVQETSGYIVRNDSITFHTTAYESSNHLLTELVSGLSAVNGKVSLAYIEGVGLRTLDAIVPSDKHVLADYLHSGLLGIYSELEGELRHSISETLMNGVYGQLNSKIAFINGPVGIPYDLSPLAVKVGERVQGNLGKHAILDNDCSQRSRFPFDPDEVLRRLRIVKAGASQVFYKSVTPFALESWR